MIDTLQGGIIEFYFKSSLDGYKARSGWAKRRTNSLDLYNILLALAIMK